MADKLDHLLSDYFTGKLATDMKLRRMELQYHNVHDENVGGGRMQNSINRVAETTIIHIENDPQLQLYAYQKEIIETVLSFMDDNVVRVVKDYYGNRVGWVALAMNECVDERTARRWRDNFKDELSKWHIV